MSKARDRAAWEYLSILLAHIENCTTVRKTPKKAEEINPYGRDGELKGPVHKPGFVQGMKALFPNLKGEPNARSRP